MHKNDSIVNDLMVFWTENIGELNGLNVNILNVI